MLCERGCVSIRKGFGSLELVFPGPQDWKAFSSDIKGGELG